MPVLAEVSASGQGGCGMHHAGSVGHMHCHLYLARIDS